MRSDADSSLARTAGGWAVGDPPVRVTTASGVVYVVDSAGYVSGQGGALSVRSYNKLLGAVRRPRGELRLEVILPGWRMEIFRSGRSFLTTSPVVEIEFLTEGEIRAGEASFRAVGGPDHIGPRRRRRVRRDNRRDDEVNSSGQ